MSLSSALYESLIESACDVDAVECVAYSWTARREKAGKTVEKQSISHANYGFQAEINTDLLLAPRSESLILRAGEAIASLK